MNGSSEPQTFQRKPRSWFKKFSDAGVGLFRGIKGQNSFWVHLPTALAVLALAAYLNLPMIQWCLLILCIGVVLAAELFNSSIEYICRSITDQVDPDIQAGLDIASAAVLIIALTATTVGGLIFLNAVFA